MVASKMKIALIAHDRMKERMAELACQWVLGLGSNAGALFGSPAIASKRFKT